MHVFKKIINVSRNSVKRTFPLTQNIILLSFFLPSYLKLNAPQLETMFYNILTRFQWWI